MSRQTALVALILVALVAFAGGAVFGAYGLGRVGDEPCWQVQRELQPAQDKLAETFGSGEEGRAAIARAHETTKDRPDCFDPRTRAFFEKSSKEPPEESSPLPAKESTSEDG